MKLIGIHGRARSGKDTLAEFLVNHHGFLRVGLADPLREFVASLIGISAEELMDGDTKEAPIPHLGYRSPREMMQTLGTEWGREMVAQDIWLQAAQVRIDQARRDGYVGVVVPDVRFDNEARWVIAQRGTVVKIERPGITPVAAHSSEDGISPDLVGATVDNSGSLGDLVYAASILAHS